MIYEPAEDSFLLEKEVKKIAKGEKVLDVGSGSGIQAMAAMKAGASEALAVDIDPGAVKCCRQKGIKTVKSDLFSRVKGKFDLIIFNPPYLPLDSREDSESALVTSGGKGGDEIIVRFLCEAEKYLEKGGKILLVVSSLTPLKGIEKALKERGFVKRVAASEKFFMEELYVLEIHKT